jgi:PAS domain S-box-containing protein
METINSVIHTFDSRFGELSSSYSALQKRIDDLDFRLREKNTELLNNLKETENLRNLLNSILQSINDAVIAVDVKGIISVANNAACQLMDMQEDALVGHRYTSIFSGRSITEFMNTAKDAEKKEVSSEEREIVTKSGRRKIIESSVTSLLPSLGQSMGMVEVLRDITEAKKLRQELKRAEIFGALTQMASFFADEIRNPLAGIVGNLNLLSENELISDESVNSIQECVNKLSDLVSDLHLLTRPVEPTYIRTDLKEFVYNVTSHFFNQNNYQTQYSLQLPEDNIQVSIDPILLQQALINILSNAVDAIDEGGDIRIMLKTEKGKWKSTGEIVLLIVEDTGCGMSDEIKEKMFTPFFTTKASGRGLGLSMARHFVRFQNGDIKTDTAEGKGTKVVIYLNSA